MTAEWFLSRRPNVGNLKAFREKKEKVFINIIIIISIMVLTCSRLHFLQCDSFKILNQRKKVKVTVSKSCEERLIMSARV